MVERFGPYEILGLIGRGGMGEVTRARDVRKNRLVALKRISQELSQDEIFKRRFRLEAEATARLNAPHVIPIHDYGEIGGRLYLDMRLVDGDDLAALLRERGPLGLELCADYTAQVASALDAAHAHGLVHRDVKPTNILLTESAPGRRDRDFAYLIDFGIAASLSTPGLTSTGVAPGTALYMSPERITGHSRGDARADVYALGCVAFEMLTGRPAFGGPDVVAVMWNHVNAPVPRPSDGRTGIPDEADAAVMRALAKRPEQRFPTCGDFVVALRGRSPQSWPAPSGPRRESQKETEDDLAVRLVPALQGAGPPRKDAPPPPGVDRRPPTGKPEYTVTVPRVVLAFLVTVIVALIAGYVVSVVKPHSQPTISPSPGADLQQALVVSSDLPGLARFFPQRSALRLLSPSEAGVEGCHWLPVPAAGISAWRAFGDEAENPQGFEEVIGRYPSETDAQAALTSARSAAGRCGLVETAPITVVGADEDVAFIGRLQGSGDGAYSLNGVYARVGTVLVRTVAQTTGTTSYRQVADLTETSIRRLPAQSG